MVAFPTYRLFLVVAALLCVLTGDAQAIDKEDPLERRLSVRALDQAFPEADEVGEISGRPAVAEVLIDDALAGYVLSTYDIDPIGGFTGLAFDLLVGIDLDGRLRGVHRSDAGTHALLAEVCVCGRLAADNQHVL